MNPKISLLFTKLHETANVDWLKWKNNVKKQGGRELKGDLELAIYDMYMKGFYQGVTALMDMKLVDYKKL